MNKFWTQHCWAALAVVLGAGIGPAGVGAQEAAPAYSWERVAFDAADTDGDGVVNEAEMTRDAAVGFAALDKDGSGTLTPEELGPHDPALFAKVDADGNGQLTFKEVMTNKVRAFDQGDTNDDGALSYDEMTAIVRNEAGEAP